MRGLAGPLFTGHTETNPSTIPFGSQLWMSTGRHASISSYSATTPSLFQLMTKEPVPLYGFPAHKACHLWSVVGSLDFTADRVNSPLFPPSAVQYINTNPKKVVSGTRHVISIHSLHTTWCSSVDITMLWLNSGWKHTNVISIAGIALSVSNRYGCHGESHPEDHKKQGYDISRWSTLKKIIL